MMKIFLCIILQVCYVLSIRAQSSYDSIDTSIKKFMNDRKIPGFAACVVKDKAIIWSNSYGEADIQQHVPMSLDGIMNIGSVSKTFTTAAAMQLWEKGVLHLNADINDYLEFDVRNPKYPDVPITIWQILTHTSSIIDGKAYHQSYACGDPVLSLNDWIKGCLTRTGKYYDVGSNFNDSLPGTTRRYSNVSFGLLGLIVEKVSGQPFNVYCKEHIFKPLGMKNTGWLLSEVNIKRHIKPYAYVTEEERKNLLENKHLYHKETQFAVGTYTENCLYSFPNYPDGLVRTSVRELSFYLTAMMNGGEWNGKRILKKETIDKMLSLQIKGNNSQGLTWHTFEFEPLPGDITLWGHTGGDPGITTFLFFNPANKIGVITFQNAATGGTFRIVKELYLGEASKYKHADSIKISGHVKWKSPAITGFPERVKVTSTLDSSIAIYVNVDSFGRYASSLPPGSYTIAPAKEYHFSDDRFIRIDNHDDNNFAINLSSGKEVIVPTLELDTMVQPGGIPERGIMFHFSYKKAKLLDEFVRKQMAFYQIPGASLALVRKGKVVYHQVYGVENSKTNEPVTEKTLFEAGSVTKPVFAFVIMRLVEKGILDLDKPLYQYLAFKDVEHDERYRFITARHVLSHRTGFPNWAQRNAKGQFDLKFTPGTAFGYSGEAYEYLKRVVEHISHKEIGQILKEELLVPLNWKNVYFQGNSHVAEFEANGHIDNSPTEVRMVAKPQMSFSMVVEARSFTTFMLALGNRKGLKPDTYSEMLKIHSASEAGVNWSLGFRIENSPFGLVYSHGGSTGPGFICNFSYFKDLDMGFVMFTNSHVGEWLCIPLLTQFLITGKKAT